MNAESIQDRTKAMRKCLQASVSAFKVPDETYLSVSSWEQSFANMACGFPGISGQAITRALVVTVTNLYSLEKTDNMSVRREGNGTVRVYIDGRFAYEIKNPNKKFYDDVAARRLDGAVRYHGQYEEKS